MKDGPKIEAADGSSKTGAAYRKSNYHKFLKKAKNRHERRKAKRKPDCLPTYGKYSGYEI
jgi:hypothetical protein